MTDLDKPLVPTRVKAERRWNNYRVEKAFKKDNNKKIKPGVVTRVQTKFAKEIRTMLREQTQRNLLYYKLSQRALLYRLKREKLRRLEAALLQKQENSNV